MRDELATPSKNELVADEALPIEIALQLAEDLVDEHVGPIVEYAAGHDFYHEYSNVYQYVTRVQDTTVFSDTGRSDPQNTTGSGLDEGKAQIKALAEAIERYCFTLTDLEDFAHGEAVDVSLEAADPLCFNKFSDRQLEARDLTREQIREAEYYWTAATELVSGQRTLIPAQTVYLPFPESPQIRNPTSNGSAAHTSPRKAVLGGIGEVIERESFVIHFLNELPAPVLDPTSVDDERLATYHSVCRQKGLDVTLLDLTLDQPLYTCLAVGYTDRKNRMIDLGLGAAATQLEAARDAMRELLQISKWETSDSDAVQEPGDIISLNERAHYWTGRDPEDDLSFWLDPDREPQPIPSDEERPNDVLNAVLQWLSDNDFRCFVVDATTDDIADQGFVAVKAVIPALHPLYLIRDYRYLGGDRLYTVPVDVGLLDAPNDEAELNDTPHPFL
ncbi:YcaO-like family protein [Haloplanus halophilus]|uniref:YcaO-like family protein n=1 Tax=Haloplanus halophilus TaxID=2949993 RepID=UPI00203BC149|nr:YcaO-like family protein [Haloplanus sp. GDY1]